MKDFIARLNQVARDLPWIMFSLETQSAGIEAMWRYYLPPKRINGRRIKALYRSRSHATKP